MLIPFLYSIVSLVVVLGIMIVVHEFGHFAAAKMFGVRVEVFSVGFGKRLFGWYRGRFTWGSGHLADQQPADSADAPFPFPGKHVLKGEPSEESQVDYTDYRVSALPLGGYVKMSGENPLDSRTGDPGEFMSHPRWQRFVIALAGPAMNLILAVALLTGVYMVRYEHPLFLDQPAVVGYVLDDTSAAKAGLEAGDRIIRVGDVDNPTWQDLIPRMALSPNQPVHITVQRGQQYLEKTITPAAIGPDGMGDSGLIPEQPLTITMLEPGMPAAKAGLQVGDEIVAVDNVPVKSTNNVKRYLQQTKDKAVEVTFLRNGQEQRVKLVPELDKEQSEYRIGFRSEPLHVDKLAFVPALTRAIDTNKRNSLLVLDLVRKMVERKVSVKTMSGPIGIARESGRAAQQKGWTPLMELMAMISLQLGIFNLFPIPILDGGLILMLAIESIIRRDISQQLKEKIYQAAFVCLILFAGLVIFNDVMKLLPGIAQRIQ